MRYSAWLLVISTLFLACSYSGGGENGNEHSLCIETAYAMPIDVHTEVRYLGTVMPPQDCVRLAENDIEDGYTVLILETDEQVIRLPPTDYTTAPRWNLELGMWPRTWRFDVTGLSPSGA